MKKEIVKTLRQYARKLPMELELINNETQAVQVDHYTRMKDAFTRSGEKGVEQYVKFVVNRHNTGFTKIRNDEVLARIKRLKRDRQRIETVRRHAGNPLFRVVFKIFLFFAALFTKIKKLNS
jgi:hypothetical protein